MIVFFQGRFVPESRAKVSIFDRSLLYGDGLFETIRILEGTPFRWRQHVERLERGAAFLGIGLPFSAQALAERTAELIRRTRMNDALLRITLSRGVGKRGYSPAGAAEPWLSLSLHPAPATGINEPAPWRLITSALRLPAHDPLAEHKTANKLRQVLARAEAEANGADDALLLNTRGAVAEATGANLFWIQGAKLWTPPLGSGALPGITRGVVAELCRQLRLDLAERPCLPRSLRRADGVFLSLSSVGIVEAVELDDVPLERSPITAHLHQAYRRLLVHETRSALAVGSL